MKKLLFLFVGLALLACKPKPVEPSIVEDVNVSVSSIQEGDTLLASEVSGLVLTYSANVQVVAGKSITLNGQPIVPVYGNSRKELVFPLELQDSVAYTLSIEKGAIANSKDANHIAPAYTLHFYTYGTWKPTPPVTQFLRQLGWGWNLGNHFDTSSGKDGKKSNFWDNAKPTEQLYKNLKAMGASTVRMPVTWGNYQDVEKNYAIDADYMALVKQNVDWALNAGLYVVLNTHHDEYWIDIVGAAINASLKDSISERITITWTQIAETFQYADDHLIMETFNELHNDSWGWGGNNARYYALQNEWNQVAVDAIRATGGNNATRWIGVPGFCANINFTMEGLVLPNDPAGKIMVGVHNYDPYLFAQKAEVNEWGHTSSNKECDEAYFNDLFQQLYDKYIANNIPCYLGEYGCVVQPTARGEQFRNYYLEYFCRCAYMHNLPVMLWDNNNNGGGERFYFINHKDGSFYNEPLVKLMIKAATSTDPTYTLESIYNKAPK